MIRTLALALPVALALTPSLVGAARAETIPPYPPARPVLFLVRPEVAKPASPIALRYAQAPVVLPRGVAKTSVERREGGVTGAAGLLCGLQPNSDDSGVGAARRAATIPKVASSAASWRSPSRRALFGARPGGETAHAFA